ncbi:MAG: hypothetical protein JW995_13630 [Melioribacteraceae bacterium]|nr:hypothetical protein [Melioribacteraceae bacterium]
MRIDISFIPEEYLNHSLIKLINKEITYPYKKLDEIKGDTKALRKFYEERSNYLSLLHHLSKLEEDLYLKDEYSLAQKCHEYIINLEKRFKVLN